MESLLWCRDFPYNVGKPTNGLREFLILWKNSLKVLPSEKRLSSFRRKKLSVIIESILNDFICWHAIVVRGLGNID